MAQRLLLCRPQGGLNDMLCQIEACCRYGERSGRTVIVDTNYAGSTYFRDDLRNYFHSRHDKLILGLDDPSTLDRASVFPHFLQDRVNGYAATWGPCGAWNEELGREWNGWIDEQARQALTFDFDKSYREDLLVHHSQGRSKLAPFVFLRMTLHEQIGQELRRRLGAIGGPYDAIHVRHTDYQASYQGALESLVQSPPARLFVATDNIQVLKEFVDALGAHRVFAFSALPASAGTPMHHLKLSGDKSFLRNRDSILDLLMLALAVKPILVKLKDGPPLSGFSELGHALWTTKPILKHLIARDDIQFGLH